MPTRNRIFVSYSRKDKKFLEEFETMMSPATRKFPMVLWHDQMIRPGVMWQNEIQEALTSASVAVLLVTKNFLNSPYIVEQELPFLFKAAREGKLTIFWIYFSECLYEFSDLQFFQA